MQPIEPAVGGGRLRLLGLYHNLGELVETTYVGTYDWPGPGYRDHQLTPTLREIDVPLSDRHFAASDEWRRLAGGKTVIDASFPMLAHHSPEYVQAAKAAARDADVVVCSHPWVYPLVRDVLDRPGQLLVYDAQNVESVLRYRLLADSEIGLRIVRHATAVERELCRRADLVLTCSHEDRDLFHRLYEIPFGKCLVMPNGTFVGEAPCDSARRERKRRLGLDDKPLAVFLGSLYPPNEEAAAFICTELAPALPDVTFAICGGVGSAIDRRRAGSPGDRQRAHHRRAGRRGTSRLPRGGGCRGQPDVLRVGHQHQDVRFHGGRVAGDLDAHRGARHQSVRIRAAHLRGGASSPARSSGFSRDRRVRATVWARPLDDWRARAIHGSGSRRVWDGC